MGKGPIKALKRKTTQDYVTCEAQISKDKRTFVIRIESGRPMSWYEAHQAVLAYSNDVVEEAEKVVSSGEH